VEAEALAVAGDDAGRLAAHLDHIGVGGRGCVLDECRLLEVGDRRGIMRRVEDGFRHGTVSAGRAGAFFHGRDGGGGKSAAYRQWRQPHIRPAGVDADETGLLVRFVMVTLDTREPTIGVVAL
jgi:hypothetical protein